MLALRTDGVHVACVNRCDFVRVACSGINKICAFERVLLERVNFCR